MINAPSLFSEFDEVESEESADTPMTRDQLRNLGYYEKHRLKSRDSYLRSKYGISLMQYQEMLTVQDGRCALCGTSDPKPGGRRRVNGDKRSGGSGFAVDHDHETGKVRGLLCRHCNCGLGHFQDDPDLIDKAAVYLRTA